MHVVEKMEMENVTNPTAHNQKKSQKLCSEVTRSSTCGSHIEKLQYMYVLKWVLLYVWTHFGGYHT